MPLKERARTAPTDRDRQAQWGIVAAENQRLFLAETKAIRRWQRRWHGRSRGFSAFLTDASVSAARRVAVSIRVRRVVYNRIRPCAVSPIENLNFKYFERL